ncbi:ASCH domain-containing protein [Caldalkalibacillus salinus]|uniref:ASCH domain-containing protein n=1 Tax=Caldalkalibacillus salinus TaxID=2803787 RepID=UPI00192040C1|nr:ASCH domain-containing protein [Caldalkalibacillus salinus]
MAKTVESLWKKYLSKIGESPTTTQKTYQAWHFHNNEEDANALAKLVKNRVKTATASLYQEYIEENESLPEVGQYNIITDWDGHPVCVIQTIKVDVKPFQDVDETFAFKEGEGDKSLRYWREAHWDFFSALIKEFKFDMAPSNEMLVVCEEFEVVDEI